MFNYDGLTNSASSNGYNVCSGCLCATVCKWRDKAMQAEAEIKEKTKIDRNATADDVYKILDIKVSCKYKQSNPVTRLYNGDYGDIAIPCKATGSDQTHVNTISSPKSGEYTGSTIRNITGTEIKTPCSSDCYYK